MLLIIWEACMAATSTGGSVLSIINQEKVDPRVGSHPAPGIPPLSEQCHSISWEAASSNDSCWRDPAGAAHAPSYLSLLVLAICHSVIECSCHLSECPVWQQQPVLFHENYLHQNIWSREARCTPPPLNKGRFICRIGWKKWNCLFSNKS